MFTDQHLAAFAMLGVSPWADEKTIQQAWRALVRSYHPDQVAEDKAAANARLSELNQAYDVVLRARVRADAELRKRAQSELGITRTRTSAPKPQPTVERPRRKAKRRVQSKTGPVVLGFSAAERATIRKASAGFATGRRAYAPPAPAAQTQVYA